MSKSAKSSTTTTTVVEDDSGKKPKSKTPPSTIVLIVICVLCIIFFAIALALILTGAGTVPDSDSTSVTAAGALIGISIPFAIIAVILGVMWVNKKSKGMGNTRGLGIAFIVFSVLASILLIIGVIITFTVAGKGNTAQLEAGAVFAILGFILFIVIFIIVVAKKRKTMTSQERQTQGENILGKDNYNTYRSYKGKSTSTRSVT